MHTTRRHSIVLPTLTALVLAACGGGGTATSGPGGPTATSGGSATQAPGGAATQAQGGETDDACPLLTAADIEAVTGFATKASEPGPQSGIFPSGCAYELVDDDAMVPPSISLGVMRTAGKDYYDKYFAPLNEENGYEAIEDLGDEAVNADFGSVLVVSGDTFLQVQYLGGGFGSGDEDAELAAELAGKVVANLGG